MKTRPRLVAPLVVGLVLPVLTLAATAPAQSSSDDHRSARVAPRAVLTLSAPIVQPGGRPASSTRAKVFGTIRFRPHRNHRPVILQRRVEGGGWKRFARTRENRQGVVGFAAPATAGGKTVTYRALAPRWKRNRKVVSNGQSTDAWTAAFTDEFNGTELGEQWADRTAVGGSRACSTVGDPRARSVGGGTLRLQVRLDPERRHQWCRITSGPDRGKYRYHLNGQVSTSHLADLGSYAFGTFAARIKFQQKRGQHGSFWLQPLKGFANVDDDPGESGAEIDVAEFFGQGYQKGGLASFLYNYGIEKNGDPVKIGGMVPRATRMLPRRDAWWKRYHVFSLEWTPRSYTFLVDGRPHYRTTRGVSEVPEYLILSLLSSDWELKQAKKHHIQPGGPMQVDWARVWQQES